MLTHIIDFDFYCTGQKHPVYHQQNGIYITFFSIKPTAVYRISDIVKADSVTFVHREMIYDYSKLFLIKHSQSYISRPLRIKRHITHSRKSSNTLVYKIHSEIPPLYVYPPLTAAKAIQPHKRNPLRPVKL